MRRRVVEHSVEVVLLVDLVLFISLQVVKRKASHQDGLTMLDSGRAGLIAGLAWGRLRSRSYYDSSQFHIRSIEKYTDPRLRC
ncbi:hypothetical protein Ocin01_10586 [Orchesella cincta]|uniref:Uncharacterized protein n=1 Tax=Orchesella cincta TaxID=48709 RepID=A0A1D2MSS7_ORCCI|nr:hypothetical protein Ocin01_10586 [Orchesella cincta]